MQLQTLLKQRNMTKYSLSKISGVPKTTVLDICSGKSSMEKCSAKTVYQLAKALDCSMEELMELESPLDYHIETGLPIDNSYLERNIPLFLQEAIEKMKKAWEKIDAGKECFLWDCDYCELQSEINVAETGNAISPEQAWYLREKYLRIEREN